jgi:hypothetical protein
MPRLRIAISRIARQLCKSLADLERISDSWRWAFKLADLDRREYYDKQTQGKAIQ